MALALMRVGSAAAGFGFAAAGFAGLGSFLGSCSDSILARETAHSHPATQSTAIFILHWLPAPRRAARKDSDARLEPC